MFIKIVLVVLCLSQALAALTDDPGLAVRVAMKLANTQVRNTDNLIEQNIDSAKDNVVFFLENFVPESSQSPNPDCDVHMGFVAHKDELATLFDECDEEDEMDSLHEMLDKLTWSFINFNWRSRSCWSTNDPSDCIWTMVEEPLQKAIEIVGQAGRVLMKSNECVNAKMEEMKMAFRDSLYNYDRCSKGNY